MSLLSANLAVKPRAFYKPDRTRRDPPFLLRRGHHLPPSPSLFLYSQFLSHPPFLFPRFSYLLLYLCGLSLSLFYSVSPRSPVLSSSSALRSSFIVHSCPSVYTNRASSSNQRPVDYTLSNLVDTRTPFLVVFLFVPSSGLSSRRGRRPASSGRANLFSADAITRSDAHATLFPLEMVLCDVCDNKGERSLVVGGNVVTLLDRGRLTFPREGICSSSLKFDELAQLAYRATV